MRFRWKKLAAAGAAMALCISVLSVPADAMDTYVKGVTLNKKAVTLYAGASASKSKVTLKATVNPGRFKAIWVSCNKKVATVSKTGVVKAKKVGTTTVIAKAGTRQACCRVTVKKVAKKVKQITTANKTVSIKKGKTKKIQVTVLPKNATIKTVTYKSANKKIATVGENNGKVKGVKVGSTKITVSAIDGSKKKLTIKVNVTGDSVADPTDEPTDEPTQAPTDEPTGEPTTEPAPSDEPTAEPTTEPTPTPPTTPLPLIPSDPSPIVIPTPTPFTTKVEGEKDSEGNTVFTLEDDTEYLIKAVIDGEEYEIKTNGSSFAFLGNALGVLNTDKTMQEINDAFYSKGTMGGTVTFVPASGVVVSMQKDANSNSAKLDITGLAGVESGQYTMVMTETDGACSVGAQKDADNYFGATVEKNPDGSYTLTDIAGRQDGKTMGLLALLDSQARVIASTSGGNTNMTVITGGEQLIIGVGGDGGVSLKLPETYMEENHIEIFK